MRQAIRRLEIHHPVAIDNKYRVWNAFNNYYWPAHYFIDANGRIRYLHVGEGITRGRKALSSNFCRSTKQGWNLYSGRSFPVGEVGLAPSQEALRFAPDWSKRYAKKAGQRGRLSC